ncbi:hypothetical protein HDU67_009415 [Dinochytrium kinnereticum]|nr:hypothetical protein HDU67_009415 [Dinochytrium kinnereticum]
MPLQTASAKFAALKQSMGNEKDDLSLLVIDGKGHSMPKSEKEMRGIMEFLAKNLAIRNLALEAMPDVYELSKGKDGKINPILI